MKSKVNVLDTLIMKGTQTGSLADCEVVEAISQDSSLDINDIYEGLSKAGVKVVPEYSVRDDDEGFPDIGSENNDGVLNSLSQYLNEIGQYPILSPADEQILAEQVVVGKKAQEKLDEKGADLPADHKAELEYCIRQGNKAKKQLIESNLRFVVFLARPFETPNISLLDLIQSGNIGLMRGIEHYEPDKGFRLTTYVSWWIRQSIMRDMTNTGKLIRLPAYISDKVRKVNNAISTLEQMTTGQVTGDDVSDLTGMDVKVVERLQRLSQDVCSLDSPVLDDESSTFGDTIVSDAPGPDELYEQAELSEALHTTMHEVLSQKEIIVIVLRMGMDGHDAYTLEEIGKMMHLTRERIRQIERKALGKLRTTKLRKRYVDFAQSGEDIKEG